MNVYYLNYNYSNTVDFMSALQVVDLKTIRVCAALVLAGGVPEPLLAFLYLD